MAKTRQKSANSLFKPKLSTQTFSKSMEFGQMFDRETRSNVVRSPREGRQLRASSFFGQPS
jgi:hypothetical protein